MISDSTIPTAALSVAATANQAFGYTMPTTAWAFPTAVASWPVHMAAMKEEKEEEASGRSGSSATDGKPSATAHADFQLPSLDSLLHHTAQPPTRVSSATIAQKEETTGAPSAAVGRQHLPDNSVGPFPNRHAPPHGQTQMIEASSRTAAPAETLTSRI